MEKYRIHCERLSSSLDDCEKKLTGFEIQEDYHAADLRKVRKIIMCASEIRTSSICVSVIWIIFDNNRAETKIFAHVKSGK